MLRRMLTCLLLPIAAVAATPARADDVRRCMDAQGNAVYTDRACEAVQAMPRDLPPEVAAGAHFIGGFAVRGCARRPGQLLDGVRGAIEAHDVNRLANWYHWTGTGSGAAKYLMDQLEDIAGRPLVAIELMYPMGVATAEPASSPIASATVDDTLPPPQADPFGIDPTRPAAARPVPAAPAPAGPVATLPSPAEAGPAGDAGTGTASGTPLPQSAEAGPPPEGLLVQQMQGAADIASTSTRFRLVRNAGCWWIEL